MKILIIEDNLSTSDLIKEILKSYICETASAATLKEGLEKRDSFQPDIILLDCTLPGTTIDQVISKIAYLSTDSAVVILTGDDSQDIKNKVLNAGADDFLDKNILTDSNKLLAQITKAWTSFKNRLVEGRKDERIQEVDSNLTIADKATTSLADKKKSLDKKEIKKYSRFEELALTQAFENGAALAEIKGINKQQVIQIDTVDKKVDRVEGKVDHTNGTVRELKDDMAVVKLRHAAEDQLKKDIIDLLGKIFTAVKSWFFKVITFLSIGTAFIVAAWIWHKCFPGSKMPALEDIFGG